MMNIGSIKRFSRDVIFAIALVALSVSALVLKASPAFADNLSETYDRCETLNNEAFIILIKKNQSNIEYSNAAISGKLGQMQALGCDKLGPRPKIAKPISIEYDISTESINAQGAFYESGLAGVSINLGKAISLYSQSCAEKNAYGCFSFGKMLYAGKGVIQDKLEAARLYTKSCELGLAEACAKLGVMAKNGDGIATDQIGAVILFTKACDQNWGGGCAELAIMTKSGQGGLAPDPARAVQLTLKSCTEGIQQSAMGCHNLGVFALQGDGVAQDTGRAFDLFTRACGYQYAESCLNLGLMYEQGVGVKKNKNQAIKLFNKAISLDPAMVKANEHLKKLGAKPCGDYKTKTVSDLNKLDEVGCPYPKK